ncbi:MAG: RsmE family RNA methyltransferase [Candidatus Eremiobacteraeota bacterium]|nr:RsmE family RNA methyltransferase [Candidatus Eremiobacteraeota bacterium]MBV8222248.1 RsmE family RNA methyltransferase [Candidatus Eremiobacteraeota bacterium]MBV8282258.1 RsmE family RNA methyltransferase [Candidatus Eremiobacteraeota bacterium]
MNAPRFFTDAPCSAGALVDLGAEDTNHATRVLRLHDGDALVVINDGVAWDATLRGSDSRQPRAELTGRRDEQGGELPVATTVIQAITKGTKFDDVVEKTVELGARRIVPAMCERSYAQAGDAKIERWRRIARAAAQQSRRRYIPVITAAAPWAHALALVRPTIVAYEDAPAGSFAQAVRESGNAREIALAVGPEGGLAPADVEAARAARCALVSLGPTILRTETAAAAMLAALASTAGWW